MSVRYEFELDDGASLCFKINTERQQSIAPDGHDWTRLDVNKCPNCPLNSADSPHCPAALDVQPIIAQFGDLLSYVETQVTVTTSERTLSTRCDVQSALSSMLGLVMATSGCPILNRLRGLARIHLPFQNLEEVQFRLVGAWLIGQLVASRRGETPTWSLDGLNELFEEIGQVNRAFMKRLKQAAREDASYNALAMLASSALNAQMALDDPIVDLAALGITTK